MNEFNFEIPSKQSLRGIVFLAFPALSKGFKSAYIPVIFYVVQFFRNPEKYEQYLFYLGIGIFALLVFFLVRSILFFLNFEFFVENNYFILKKGILTKQRVEIALFKIQNVHISQNVLQRWLGVVTLNVDTAGDKSTEVIIKSLSEDKGNALKNILLENSKAKFQESKHQNIFKISLTNLLVAGVTQNHFNSFYLLLAIFFGLFIDFRDLMEVLGYKEFLQDLSINTVRSVSSLVLLSLVLFVLIIISSLLYSIIKVLIFNYGLKITQINEEIEIEKGLFNRISYALKSARIQSVVYRTNALKAKFGMYSLRFNQAMSAINSDKNIEIEGIKKSNLPVFEKFAFGKLINNNPENRKKPDPYFKIQLYIRTFYLLVLINTLVISLLKKEFLLINLVLVPWFVYLIYLRYKKSFYILESDYFILGEGKIDTITTIFEHHKIQSFKLKQSFFQRKRNVASIQIYTASNLMTVPCIPCCEAIQLYDYLLYRVESNKLDWN